MKMARGHCFYGLPCTWFNNRVLADAVFERLDSIVSSISTMVNLLKDGTVENWLIIGSEHGPTLLKTDYELDR